MPKWHIWRWHVLNSYSHIFGLHILLPFSSYLKKQSHTDVISSENYCSHVETVDYLKLVIHEMNKL